MYVIDRISSHPRQTQTLVLTGGESVNLTISFKPQQYGWFIDELTYNDFIIRGIRIVNNPNMLHQWCQLIPFGLGCFSATEREPSLQEDFEQGHSTLHILSETEVFEYLEYLQNG